MSQCYLGLGVEEVTTITSACDLTAGARIAEDPLAVLVFQGKAELQTASLSDIFVGT